MNYMLLGLVLFVSCVFGDSPWHNPNCADNRRTIVHLFEWKWTDIAAECERFLGPRGYCGVQVSPANEHAVIGVDADGVPDGSDYPRPWWERYQPVSYKMTSRSGTDQQFVDMVQRCNNVGVRIYVDAIINHMTGMGRAGVGSAGTEFDADEGDFPGVPYQMENFNDCSTCPACCCINDWTDMASVRNCRLSGLIDLNQRLEDTRVKITAFLNSLLELGVAGFRIDAAKHMWPDDIEQILLGVNDLDPRWFPTGSKPFIYLEVIDQNNPDEIRIQEYTHLGRGTEFRFCTKIAETVDSLWAIPGIYVPSWGMADPGDAFVFVDNHDNQRGHGGAGNVVTHKNPERYQVAQAISVGWEYGYQRVMSSYDYGDDTERGPPSDENFVTKDVIINEDGSCGNGWMCEHRWPVIAGMAGWAKATNGIERADNFWSQGNSAAWNKGDKGFVAMTREGGLTGSFYTGLPAGEYCNVIQGCATESGCEGDVITVGSDGMAAISITDSANPVLAIHVECLSGSNQCVDGAAPNPSTPVPSTGTSTTAPVTDPPTSTSTPSGGTTEFTTEPGDTTTTGVMSSTTTPPGGENWKRTIVYMRIDTQMGQDGFLRGGVTEREGCTEVAATDPCAVAIETVSLGADTHYDKYEAWRVGDSHLDWFGAESGQGDYGGLPSEGTPMAWTTDDSSHPGFQPDNSFGPNWWKVELSMDCDEAFDSDGWFEMKAFVSNRGWESDITQDITCTGSAGGSRPYSSSNHVARCGYFNVFEFNSASCVIDELPA